MNQTNKITPPKKLTPSKNTNSRVFVTRAKQSFRDISPCYTNKGLLLEQTNSESVLNSNLRIHTENREISSDSESFDCIFYVAEEFKHKFVMTSKLLYGENSNSDEDTGLVIHKKVSKVFKKMPKIQLISQAQLDPVD